MQELFTFTPYASSGDGFALSATEKDGQAWFIAAEVCRNLEIKNYRDAVAKLDDDEKGVGIADTLGGRQRGHHHQRVRPVLPHLHQPQGSR